MRKFSLLLRLPEITEKSSELDMFIHRLIFYRKLDLIQSPSERVGGTYFVGFVRKTSPQSLDHMRRYKCTYVYTRNDVCEN
jgi:hypothetical protein